MHLCLLRSPVKNIHNRFNAILPSSGLPGRRDNFSICDLPNYKKLNKLTGIATIMIQLRKQIDNMFTLN